MPLETRFDSCKNRSSEFRKRLRGTLTTPAIDQKKTRLTYDYQRFPLLIA
jgi:hypothetical protein